VKHWLFKLILLVNVLLNPIRWLTIVSVDVLDSCPGWEPILDRITKHANTCLTGTVAFHHADAVTDYLKFEKLFSKANLVTLMFTLNEMVTLQGKVAVTKFLVDVIKIIPSNSFILVYLPSTIFLI
jgi:Putative SAM-dependent methyltransferase